VDPPGLLVGWTAPIDREAGWGHSVETKGAPVGRPSFFP